MSGGLSEMAWRAAAIVHSHSYAGGTSRNDVPLARSATTSCHGVAGDNVSVEYSVVLAPSASTSVERGTAVASDLPNTPAFVDISASIWRPPSSGGRHRS